MAETHKNFLKKQPLQSRSRMTVDAILEATAYILTHEGMKHFNTNRVAEKAGVSIASLYQYFEDKDSILAELQRRHVEKTRTSAQAVSELYKDSSIDILIHQIIQSGIAAHTADPELHRIFGQIAVENDLYDSTPADVTSHLRQLKDKLIANGATPDDAEFSVWMFRTIVHAAIHEGVYHRHQDIVSGRLANALTDM